MVDVVLQSYFHTLVSESKFTGPEEVHEAFRGLKLGKGREAYS
jgi:hypothetical protein